MTLYVITGPPCVGKSTWVRERANIGDIVVDLDRLALAITAEHCPHHEYPTHIRRAAMHIRKTAVVLALNHSKGGTSYVIHAKPPKQARAIYKRHNAVFVELQAPVSVLMQRANDERPPHIAEVIRRWWDDADDY